MESRESELASRAKEGDREAFSALVGQHRTRIEAIVRMRLDPRLRRRLDTEDVVQETLLKAFQALKKFEWRTEREFRSWLLSIAESVCSDTTRRHLVAGKKPIDREVFLDPNADSRRAGTLVDLLAAPSPTPSRGLRRAERLDRLERALDTLSSHHREVIVLSILRKLSTNEIGRQLDMKPSAVCMLRSRALQKLRQVFGETDSFGLPSRRDFTDSSDNEVPGDRPPSDS
ncbi:MAG: sigma-70 family RNA polymerase sigma factor [Planctomycetota bacterium]